MSTSDPIKKPLVSVIMPTYKRQHLIGRAIDSLLAQTCSDWELLIVDDCPEDPAEDVVRRYKDERIRYFRHEKNMGGAAARNTAMERSRGDFIAFLDDDDEWLPEKIAVQLDTFAELLDSVGFSFSGAYIVMENEEVMTHVPEGVRDYFDTLVQNFNLFLGLTVMIRRSVYEDIGGWSTAQPSHQEIEWMFRIAQKYKGVGIDRPLVRAYSGSIHDHIGSNIVKRIRGRELLLLKHDEVFRAHLPAYVKHHFLLAMWYRDMGRYRDAKREIGNTLKMKWGIRRVSHFMLLTGDGLPYRLARRFGIM